MQVKLITIYDKYIEYKKPRVKKATIDNLQKVKTKLILYESKYGNLDLNDLTYKWFETFVKFMTSKRGGKLSNTTVQLYTTVLAGFLKDVKLSGYAVNEDYKRFKQIISGFKKNETGKAILAEEEMLSIWHCPDLTRAQEYVKDLFLFQCNTGIRWGDIGRIRRGDIGIQDNQYYLVDFVTQKRGTEITIHLNEICMYVIRKHSKRFDQLAFDTPVFKNVPVPSNATNKLKRVAKYAGLDRKIQDKVFYGEKQVKRVRPLYEVISTHCGRHTFASNYMKENGNIYKLKGLIGHKNITTTENYVNKLPGFIPEDITIQLTPKKKELYRIA